MEKLEEFANDLNQAIESSSPAPGVFHPYSAVHVLLLRWTDDNLMVPSEIEDLRSVFESQFHFMVQEWQIPSEGAQRALQARFYDFQSAHLIKSELLIVYYGGQGGTDGSGRSVWRA